MDVTSRFGVAPSSPARRPAMGITLFTRLYTLFAAIAGAIAEAQQLRIDTMKLYPGFSASE
jgi:hypothetical protein